MLWDTINRIAIGNCETGFSTDGRGTTIGSEAANNII